MIRNGHYYEKQLRCPCAVIAWSHRSRFEIARSLLGDGGVEQLLDYGCGDGTFLASVADRIQKGCGADVAMGQLENCMERLSDARNLHFCHVDELTGPEHEHAYDVVTCMETLEHCTETAVDRVLADLARLCTPKGQIIISVPIETGVPFLLKYFFRTFASWRGMGDYRHYESYSLSDAVRMIMSGQCTHVSRPIYGLPDTPHHSHYGFNWKALRSRVAMTMDIEKTLFSPLGCLRGCVSSQAWFVCHPKKLVVD